MKFQSLLITSNKIVDVDEINKVLKDSLSITETINELNTLNVVDSKSSIGIKDLEQVSEWINLKNTHIKFVIIHNAEKLTNEAQNSLLKNLEEPPENTLFILLSKNFEKILETIRSRCIQVRIKSKTINSSGIQHIAIKFISANYLEKLKLIDEVAKNIGNREEIAELVFEITKNIPQDSNYSNKINVLISIYKGIKNNVNLKLSLDLLAIYT